jgi:hypothetical protein
MTTPKQPRNQQGAEPMANDRSQSDDAKFSVVETRRLQQAAQAKINAKRTPGIGVAP